MNFSDTSKSWFKSLQKKLVGRKTSRSRIARRTHLLESLSLTSIFASFMPDETRSNGNRVFSNRGRRLALEGLETRSLMAAAPFSTDFAGFAGAGFAPAPAAGQLDSDDWRVTGFSDAGTTFGGTFVTASTDFTRGASTGGVTTAGVYAFNAGTVAVPNTIMGVQPTGSEFNGAATNAATNGRITVKVDNATASPISNWDIKYDIVTLNNADRSSSFNLSYSTDDTTYVSVPALDFTTPLTQDTAPASWVTTARMTSLTGVSVAAGGSLYVRWSSSDVAGAGSRDEFGLDNVLVAQTGGALPSNLSISTADSVKLEGNSGTTPFTFNVSRSGSSTGAVSVNYAVSSTAATASDFLGNALPSGTINFADGDVAPKTISLDVNGDALAEGNEGFAVTLSNATGPGATITAATANGTIVDDDSPIPSLKINELRQSHSTLDAANNFVEIYEASGAANVSLSGLTLVVVSSAFSPGQVDYAIDLSSAVTDANGFVLIANSLTTATTGAGDKLVSGFNLFGSGTTFFLVKGFTGTQGSDLDADNVGGLDSPPWLSALDSVTTDQASNPGQNYSTTIVLSADTTIPAGIRRVVNGTGSYSILDLTSTALDTPGFTNTLMAGVTVTQSGGTTAIAEGFTTDTFTVVLNTQPTADVTVNITPDIQSNLGAGGATAIALTFTSANWNVAQTVTVTAVDDTVNEGNHTSTITFATTSTDATYNAVAIPNIVVTVTDNDVPPPSVTINEIYYDSVADVNGDGTIAPTDEFIEIVNTTAAAINIGGWTLSDDDAGADFTFPVGTMLAPGQAAVLFGGGGTFVGTFGGAQVFKDDGTIGTGLSNTGDLVELRNSALVIVDSVGYGTQGSAGTAPGNSLTRNPDLTGFFVQHNTLGTPAVLYSPGLKNDGATPFSAPTNTAPTITTISAQNITSGASTAAIPFTLFDAETPNSLTVTATSTNLTLVPLANIVLSGTGANRTVTVTSVSGQTGTATIRLTVSDGALSSFTEFTVTVTPAAVAPKVETIVFGDGTAQRSMIKQITVNFDSIVTVGAGAFTLSQGGSAGFTDVPSSDLTIGVSTSNTSGKTVATLIFSSPSPSTFIQGGSLPDGNFRLTINAGLVTNAGGALDGDNNGTAGGDYVKGAVEADAFFRRFGDSNGNRTTALAELGQLRLAINKASPDPAYNPVFDANSNGVVSLAELGQLRQRINIRLDF